MGDPRGQVLVTGAAGFIGSHLVESLVADGRSVIAVDGFTGHYPDEVKRANLAGASASGAVRLVEADLSEAPLDELLRDVAVVYHLAGQPGVRDSWSGGFDRYAHDNVVATQRLLEAARRSDITRLVYASSSSVYGNADRYPCSEDDVPRPFSPYGVTKLAGEHLCGAYAQNWDVPAVALRLFTVYGPRQRPDMAFHRMFTAVIEGCPFPLYGDGSAVRDFTHVDDVVRAFRLAAERPVAPGTVCNVAGGSSASVAEVLEVVAELTGEPLALERLPSKAGDVGRTGASTDRARRLLGWSPDVDLRSGLRTQLRWHESALTRQRAAVSGDPLAVVETGVDPVTSRFSGARSAN